MNIKVVDFEKITSKYKIYQEGLMEIEVVRKEYINKINPIKNELQSILNKSIDTSTEVDHERFEVLKNEAYIIDDEFRKTMQNMNENLTKKVYSELEIIISNWSKNKNIDMIIGSTEVVFMKEENDISEFILEELAKNDLKI